METKSRPSHFWVSSAAVSVFGTLASVLTMVAPEQTMRNALHLPPEAIPIFTSVAFLVSIGGSFVGFWTMMLAGVQQVGTLDIGRWRLPLWAHAGVCIAAYLVPWGLIVLAALHAMAIGI